MSFYLNLADERQETWYKDICARETSAALSKHDCMAPEQLHHWAFTFQELFIHDSLQEYEALWSGPAK